MVDPRRRRSQGLRQVRPLPARRPRRHPRSTRSPTPARTPASCATTTRPKSAPPANTPMSPAKPATDPWPNTPTTPAPLKPKLPDVANLCRRCHEKDAAKPKTFPQVVTAEHSGGARLQRLPRAAQSAPLEEHTMDITRRDLIDFGSKLLVLASVGATLEQITGAEPAARHLQDGRPLVGHAHRYRQVHRLRQLRPRLLQGKQRPRRLLPHLGRALRDPRRTSSPQVDSPNGAHGRLPASRRQPTSRASSSPSSATTASIPPACRSARWAPPSSAPTAWCWWTRTTASAAATACRPAPTAAATCIPRSETVDKCTLCYHRITQGLTTACCENCPTGARQLVDFKNPKDPVHEFLQQQQSPGAQAVHGHRAQGLVQGPGRGRCDR